MTADGGDYTVHVVVGLDAEGRMYLLDLWRKRRRPTNGSRRSAISCCEWKPIGWAEERGADHAPASARSSTGACASGRRSSRASSSPRAATRRVRAQSMRGRMALEGLYVPAGAPWLADFRAELLSFPAGRHDDQVDAIGLVGQLLDKMVRPAKPKPAVRPSARSVGQG